MKYYAMKVWDWYMRQKVGLKMFLAVVSVMVVLAVFNMIFGG